MAIAAPLGESGAAQLVGRFGEQSYAGGTCVFNRGDKAAMVHVVRSGSVELSGERPPGLMFVGFLGIFAAISFAIARILGVFRNGGGEIQARPAPRYKR
ncbi:MAG: hypothetical protein ACR2QK_15255 [Acidimicrobiales bacterium]